MEGSKIVHWNNGLWDVGNDWGDGPLTSKEEYVIDMVRIAKILLSKYEKVIFATITPVRSGNQSANNTLISKYNSAVVCELKKLGVIINDLYSFVYPNLEEYIREDDKLHLTEAGINACAKQVAQIIKNAAEGIK